MNINILSIMDRATKEIYTFTYFDDIEYVREMANLIYENNALAAITTVREFARRKKEFYKKAYFNYMKKVREDKNLGIVDRLHTKSGAKIDVMIYDEPYELFEKYKTAWGIELDENMKKNILENFKSMVDTVITDEILNPDKKVKRLRTKK